MSTPQHTLLALHAGLADQAASMTFPAYRHMLRLEPTQRHPGELEQRDVVPLGVAALMETTLVGLALAEAPRSAGAGAPELLSLFVQPELRGRGIATDMLAQLESELLGRGFHTLDAVYMTGKPSLPALERVFAKRSWSPPKTRVVTLRFTPEEATHTPWWGRVRLGADYEIFPWTEMTPEGLEQIRQSDERSHWVAVGLEAWRHGRTAFDPVSSLGLRHRGEVVGWVINHRVTEDLVRFTCSYMRPDLARRGRIMPLYTESIKRVAGTSCRWCSFTTPIEYPQMVEFVKTRCAPYASFFGETRGTSKRLDDL